MDKKNLIMVACEVVRAEVEAFVKKSPNNIDVHFVDQGLHNVGKVKMPLELQNVLDNIDQTKYDAILLFYGLCNNGVCGLHANIPIIIPRAHDCITYFMGSKERYRTYFDDNPGTFFFASGWNESTIRGNSEASDEEMRDKYIEMYGEDNADYLMEMLGTPTAHYKRLAFINTGIGDVEKFRASAVAFAKESEWEFEEYVGETTVFENFFGGDWDEEAFLIVPPGKTIRPSYKEDIITLGEL